MIMVAFVEVLVVWSRFWRIYERGFVDLVEGTTKRMALMFGRKTILVKILFWKRVLLLLLDYHGKLYFKLVEIIIRNANPSKQEIKRFPIPSVIHSARTSSPIINYPSNTNTKKKKGKKNPQRIENELEPTCQSLRKISCPSTQSSRHSKQSDAAPPIVRLCPATVSQSSPICACENEADRKKIRDRIRIKITLPLLLVRPIISAVSVGS